jgi:hypothetical protein
MSGKDIYKDYLYDLGPIIVERAFESKTKLKSSKSAADKAFHEGSLLAFYAVISIMQQQAEGLGLPLKDLRLDNVVPDRDLT